ncbi:rhoptry neck protein ron4 [Cystoisospora suis]|uniref:Rhoptry neck protein ron4 n=1 Tax=Cystoisospora suis TaxID=483139 RepID=A0A2C6K3F1_9APIC|nr:rhoptry neck protein ron4 [Cystoisospora suis]
MKVCVTYIKAAGDVATKPFESGTVKFPARSLYGGIANTIGTKMGDAEVVAIAGRKYAQQSTGPKLVGLCAASQMSTFLKRCFSSAETLHAVTAFNLHLDGAALLNRIQAGGNPLGKDAITQTLCNPRASTPDFEIAFRLLSSTVTPQWEREGFFSKLSSPVTGALPTPSVAPASGLPPPTEAPAAGASETAEATETAGTSEAPETGGTAEAPETAGTSEAPETEGTAGAPRAEEPSLPGDTLATPEGSTVTPADVPSTDIAGDTLPPAPGTSVPGGRGEEGSVSATDTSTTEL